MKSNKLCLFLSIPLLLLSCSNSDNTGSVGNFPMGALPPKVEINSVLTLNISTDKALYNPGSTVLFNVDGNLPANAHVRYRKGNNVIADALLSSNTWTWVVPNTDFTGYIADIYTIDNGVESVYGTIGIDVSSDWSQFPRYGFVSSYDNSKTTDVINNEMAYLNRCHINGIQFYDWLYAHHHPLAGTPSAPLAEYNDIANRTILTSVIKDYINTQHNYGMKSMFYDLCYGALNTAPQNGVGDKWYMYQDQSHNTIQKLSMPSGWKSDIFLMDPNNQDWQNYMVDRVNEVYSVFGFDGYHIDQVGDQGTVYDYYGSILNLPNGFGTYINAMKSANPNKRLVMNAVSSFGTKSIAGTGNVDFLYNELWDSESQFKDIHDIIQTNYSNSNGIKKSVLAAYMDYKLNNQYFNTPGVLLTDAVIFALGGDHIELGDHMLYNEYFPASNMQMTDELKQSIIHYYDFMTAYQNLLRDKNTETKVDLSSGLDSVSITTWPPKLSTVTTYSTTVGNKQVINLINFRQANNLSWRDLDASMPEPKLVNNLILRLKSSKVNKIWAATPDNMGGAPQELTFKQSGGYVIFTVPTLKYWTMIVVE